MLNDGLTYQEQSQIPDTSEAAQLSLSHCKGGQLQNNCHHRRAQALYQPVYNCTYVYMRLRTLHYLGCMSVSSTK